MSESTPENTPASVTQPVGTKVESTVEEIGDGTEASEPTTETDQPEKDSE
jgi:hypothetical protein